MLEHFDLTDGGLLGITTVNACYNYLMRSQLQRTLEAAGIK
jgi:hypothetical protein